MDRRTFSRLTLGAACAAGLGHDVWAQGASGQKVLRLCLRMEETNFDPAQANDLYSRTITAHIFEGLFQYDYLAQPAKFKPCLAAEMPENSADYKVWTIRLKRGVRFADDPAFKGQVREVVAQDVVYSWLRLADPRYKGVAVSVLDEQDIVGLSALRQAAQATGQLDYDQPVAGLRALDRYTLRVEFSHPCPNFVSQFSNQAMVVVAREVVAHYGEQIGSHPVGTGPFKLVRWQPRSFMVLERNPQYRPVYFDAEPGPHDAEGQAWLARLKGRRLPLVDRVELSVIVESQPRWLAFRTGLLDVLTLPYEYVPQAIPQGRLAPYLAKQGIRLHRYMDSSVSLFYFNMQDPVVGGYTPTRIALRRAISLAYDQAEEIRLARHGQAIPAQSMLSPSMWGWDPALKLENSSYDLARAQALLDMYGWKDYNGDGWREQPDGSPLVLEYASQNDPVSRVVNTLWARRAVQLRIRINITQAPWAERLKAARAGKLQMWGLTLGSSSPDSLSMVANLISPAVGASNMMRFQLPAYDNIYRRMRSLPEGPERLALLREAQRLVQVYAPCKWGTHRINNDLMHARVVSYRNPSYETSFWQYVEVDDSKALTRRLIADR